MRVIAGSAKGRKLKTLEGRDVRPTTDKVKEAIFSSVQFRLSGALVLDLFAGSGQMGIEALSRGAVGVVYVDSSSRSLAVTRENLETSGFSKDAQLFQMDAAAFLKCTQLRFDMAFLDPPYHQNMHAKLLPLLEQHMQPDGIVICEHEAGLTLPEQIGALIYQKQKKYGAIAVTTFVYRKDEK